MLKKSGAILLRYTPPIKEGQESDFWYVTSNRYWKDGLSSKMRYNIRKAHKNCEVDQVSAKWLSENGYECHKNALARYGIKNTNIESYRKGVLSYQGGPFEFWSVKVNSKLAAYAITIVEYPNAALNILKIDPAFFKYLPAYSLLDVLLNKYVNELDMDFSNGTRSVSHETQFQSFLIDKFNFRPLYCGLRVVYSFLLSIVVHSLYPFRKPIMKIKGSKVKSIFYQEEIARSTKDKRYN